ncbi:MAG: hypothetical protein OER12_03135, partial [Acidimicrobiia bacterium]|nr:hypothetical protein [Acidimicrobiia bacterium]
MSELGTRLREHYDEIAPPLDTDRLIEQFVGADRYRQRLRPVMAMTAAAVLTLLVIGGVGIMILSSNSGPDVIDPPTTVTTASTETTAVTTVTTVLPSGSWNPILSTTRAKAAPPAATCPQDTDPNAPGPVDQARPGEGPWSNQAAVFDTRAGRIVFIDEGGETWTFDVCTNTWQAMDPTFVPVTDAYLGEGLLVYDIDSDRTIAFGPRNVYAYDAAANTWTR